MIEYRNEKCLVLVITDITERCGRNSNWRAARSCTLHCRDQTEFIVRWLPGGIRTFVNDAYCSTSV